MRISEHLEQPFSAFRAHRGGREFTWSVRRNANRVMKPNIRRQELFRGAEEKREQTKWIFDISFSSSLRRVLPDECECDPNRVLVWRQRHFSVYGDWVMTTFCYETSAQSSGKRQKPAITASSIWRIASCLRPVLCSDPTREFNENRLLRAAIVYLSQEGLEAEARRKNPESIVIFAEQMFFLSARSSSFMEKFMKAQIPSKPFCFAPYLFSIAWVEFVRWKW